MPQHEHTPGPLQHGQAQTLTPAQVAQIPPARRRAIIAAGLMRQAWAEVARHEAALLAPDTAQPGGTGVGR